MTWQRDESNTAIARASGRAHTRVNLRSRVRRAAKGKPHVAASGLTALPVASDVAQHAATHGVARGVSAKVSTRVSAKAEIQPNGEHEGYLIKELQHLLRAQIEARIRAKGLWLSFPHSAVLMMLSEQPGLSGAQLARRCSVTAQTMNGLLMPLEKKV